MSDATLAKLAAATAAPPALPQTGAFPDHTWMLVLAGLGIFGLGVAFRYRQFYLR